MTDETTAAALSPGRNFSDADLERLAQLQAAAAPPVAPGAVAPVAPAAPVANAFAVGQLVTHAWTDDYEGDSQRDGIVVEVVPDDGTGPKVVLSYLEKRTGNIPESQITAV